MPNGLRENASSSSPEPATMMTDVTSPDQDATAELPRITFIELPNTTSWPAGSPPEPSPVDRRHFLVPPLPAQVDMQNAIIPLHSCIVASGEKIGLLIDMKRDYS